MRQSLASLLVVLLISTCHPQSVFSPPRNTTEADDLATRASHQRHQDDSSSTSHSLLVTRNYESSDGHSPTITPPSPAYKYTAKADSGRDKDDSDERDTQFTTDQSHHESIMLKASQFHRDNLTVENLKTETPYQRKKLTVGYLTAVRGDMKERQGLAVSGAIKMAIDKV